MKDKFDKLNNISSDAVCAKTGKGWAEWIAILDRAGAKKMTHQEIVACLRNEHQVGAWWQQMITVGYEQPRKKRAAQRPDGYQISVSKTINMPVAKLYATWQAHVPRDLAVSKATTNKSVRGAWQNGASRVDIAFYDKGASKGQITIQHNKLASARDAAKMKTFWATILAQIVTARSVT